MVEGGKLLTDDGVEVSIFPSLVMNTTQGAGGYYSHSCSYASDNASPFSDKLKIYAPCEMKLVRKAGDAGNTVYFHTTKPALTPFFGEQDFTLLMIHCNDISFLQEGKVYQQGDLIYEEGIAGNVTGRHVHYNVGLGHQNFMIQKPCGDWELPDSEYIDNIFYKNLTEIVNENASSSEAQGWRNYDFKEFEGGYVPPDIKVNDDILVSMLVRALPSFF